MIGTFKLTADNQGLAYGIDPGLTVSMDKQKAKNDELAGVMRKGLQAWEISR